MSLEVQVAKSDQNPLRIYLALETMQQRQIGTGDLITLKKQDRVILLIQAHFADLFNKYFVFRS